MVEGEGRGGIWEKRREERKERKRERRASDGEE